MMRIMRALATIINMLPENMVRYIGSKASEFLLDKYAKLEVTGADLLPERIGRPTIFIANHLSNVDGIVLNQVLKENNVTFMAGVKLNEDPLTSMFLKTVKHIPINPNSADRDALRQALAVLSMGESILIFPEGTRSRSGAMIKGKKGFLLLARLSKADIVPIALEGTELLLPIHNDMGKETLQHASVRVSIGQPFQLEKKDHSNDNWDEDCLYAAMTRIAQMLKPEYQGVYRMPSTSACYQSGD